MLWKTEKKATHEPLVPGVQDSFEHGLVEETVSHPLADDDVNLLDAIWQSDLLHLASDQSDYCRHTQYTHGDDDLQPYSCKHSSDSIHNICYYVSLSLTLPFEMSWMDARPHSHCGLFLTQASIFQNLGFQ